MPHLSPENVRYRLIDGAWEQTSEPSNPQLPNFVIVCREGDWSGFRPLAACLRQVPWSGPQRPNGYYWIEER